MHIQFLPNQRRQSTENKENHLLTWSDQHSCRCRQLEQAGNHKSEKTHTPLALCLVTFNFNPWTPK